MEVLSESGDFFYLFACKLYERTVNYTKDVPLKPLHMVSCCLECFRSQRQTLQSAAELFQKKSALSAIARSLETGLKSCWRGPYRFFANFKINVFSTEIGLDLVRFFYYVESN